MNIKIKNKNNDRRIINRLFRSVAIVMILSNLSGAITTFTDGIFASQYIGDFASAGLQVAYPSILFCLIFTTLIETGCQVLCSRTLARGDRKQTNTIFSLSLIITLSISILAIFINIFAAGSIASISGATADTAEYAVGYMRGYYIGSPFMALLLVLMPIANLEGNKIVNYVSAITIMLVNLVGDLVASLYFKTTFAIGLATSIAYICGILVLMFHFLSKKTMLRFSFKNISFKLLRELIVTGGPNSAKAGFVFARNIVVNNIIALVGSNVAMTAFSCQAHISPFLESITIGLISACLMLSSIFYSEEDVDALNNLIKTLIRWVLTVVLGFAIIYFILAPYISKFYGVGGGDENDEAFIQTVWAMRADAISSFFIALNSPFLAIFQGTKRNKYAYVVSCLQSFILPITLLCTIACTIQTDISIWFGMTAGYACYTILHFAYAWISAKKISIDVKTLFFLPDNFGYKDEEKIHFTIANINDALNVSQSIIDFCRAHQVDNRRMYHLASCAEEMAIMTVLSGFTRDKKKHTCEMRVLYKNNNLTLRIRDDCAKFNIKEKNEKMKEGDDPTKNMEIRMVMGLAKNVEYVNLLKTNNLLITI